MVRVTFQGADLEGFVSLGHDDHVKLIFSDCEARMMRDFTPRRYDAVTRELTIDFARHDVGPASDWAAQARPGQQLEVGGPRSSFVVRDDFDAYLLIGDETALPAIGRWLEALWAGARAVVLAAVTDATEEQAFSSAATVETHWVRRPLGQAADPRFLLDALKVLRLPGGDVYAWVAAESGVARTLRQHLVAELRLESSRIKAAGYWRQGGAGVHERLDD
jgi:NADPH-dependent ferric siderophore reductase